MPKKILLIDDDALVLKTLTNLLQSQGYEVHGFKNGEEAIKAFKEQDFDLIVTDVRMPGQDGIQTLKKIRELEKVSGSDATPTVVVTGYASEEAPVQALELETKGYILKPFDYDRFLTTIKKALGELKDLDAVDSNLQKICSAMKKIILDYHHEHEREIFDNENLKDFFSELESSIEQLERELVKTNLHA